MVFGIILCICIFLWICAGSQPKPFNTWSECIREKLQAGSKEPKSKSHTCWPQGFSICLIWISYLCISVWISDFLFNFHSSFIVLECYNISQNKYLLGGWAKVCNFERFCVCGLILFVFLYLWASVFVHS